MRRRVKSGIYLGLILLLGWAGTGCGPGSAPTDAPEARKVPVTTQAAAKGDVTAYTVVSGMIAADKEVKVVPKMAGKVARVHVEMGSKVQAGQVLLELENNDIQAQVRVAEAGLAGAKIKLEEAKKNLERMEALFQEGVITAQAYEQAKSGYDGAQVAVDQAAANLDLVRANLDNTVIKAPVAGEVSACSINPGEMASPSVPVVTIVCLDQVYIDANVGEREINLVQAGQEVMVKVAAVSAGPLTGVITNVSPAADSRNKTYPIRVKLDNGNRVLRPGMFAEVQLTTQHRSQVLLLPAEAVVERNGVKMVYVVADGKAQERKVELGLTDGRVVEIVSGLTEGEPVVVAGQQTLVDGTPVTVGEEGN